ncbi:hypothetical protein RhiirA4_480610 [Rhizophagus irregularis]|uniref:Uncharacterized protein n=1 Tax=Rhizophagus irregularis TaxID=588596 RepID=A0A2I1HI83_9GLOM|nr:hypothetical protein RhiirA4_480610 [Rhizophagus irregularis]
MNTSEDFIGQNDKSYYNNNIFSIFLALISYLSDNWKNLDNLWTIHFLRKGKHFPDLKNKGNP